MNKDDRKATPTWLLDLLRKMALQQESKRSNSEDYPLTMDRYI